MSSTFISIKLFFFENFHLPFHDDDDDISFHEIQQGVQAKLKDESSQDDAKKKKSQRNYPVYYVNTKVNGKFGKNVRAFTSEEFVEQYPVRY